MTEKIFEHWIIKERSRKGWMDSSDSVFGDLK